MERMRQMAEAHGMGLAKSLQDAVLVYEREVAAGYGPGTRLATWASQETQETGAARPPARGALTLTHRARAGRMSGSPRRAAWLVFANPNLLDFPGLRSKAFCVWFPTMLDHLRKAKGRLAKPSPRRTRSTGAR